MEIKAKKKTQKTPEKYPGITQEFLKKYSKKGKAVMPSA